MGLLLVLAVTLPPGAAQAPIRPATVSGLPSQLSWSYANPIFPPASAFSGTAEFSDAGSSYILYDGGTGACGKYCDASWELDPNGPGGAPTLYEAGSAGTLGRMAPSMVWDPSASEFLLFGGLNGTVGALNDTWAFPTTGGGWEPVETPTSPPARWDASMVYDPLSGGVFLFGGYGVDGRPLGDTWEFREGNWTQLSLPVSPSARAGATWTFDAGTNQTVLFGGIGATGYLGDTWAFEQGHWWALHPTTSPSPRSNASATTDSPGDPLVFGGLSAPGLDNDTWDLVGGNWSEIPLSEPTDPEPREGASLVGFSEITDNLLFLTDGWGAQGAIGDAWFGGLYEAGGAPPTLPLSFSASLSASTGSAPLSVQFQSDTFGGVPPYSWRWGFGDGTPGGWGPDPGHTYDHPGRYTIPVSVEDSSAIPRTANTTLTVTVGSAPGAFSTTFSALPSAGAPPLLVSFSPDFANGSGPYQLNWSFGDGSPVSHATDPTHAYNTSGLYLASLEATDAEGAEAYWSATIDVGLLPLHVALSASRPSGQAPLTELFNAASTGGQGPFTYDWSFGDGTSLTSLVPEVSHEYNSTGNYTTNVTVVDALGEHATGSTLVTVYAPPFIPPPPPTLAQRVWGDLSAGVAVLVAPVPLAVIFALLATVSTWRWGVPAWRRSREVHRATRRRRPEELWGVGLVAALLTSLRAGEGLRRTWATLAPLLRQDARALAHRLRWSPGPLAVWSFRRALLVIPQFLLAVTVLFVGLDLVPYFLLGETVPGYPATPPGSPVGNPTLPLGNWAWEWLTWLFGANGGPAFYLSSWWNFLSSLVRQIWTDPFLQAYLPYSIELLVVVVGLSALLAYPLGLLTGWYRGRILDQTTRAGSTLALAIPMFVVALLVLGWSWKAYAQLTGDDPVGSLPSTFWFSQNMGGIPSWIGSNDETYPTHFSLLDAPLHGAWGLEGVLLLKLFLQAFAIAAVYTAIFLRYARLATEEFSYELPIVGARSRGVSERTLLWTHTSRRVAPLYVAIFATTFPTLLFVQFVAEWAFLDLGLGVSFFLHDGGPSFAEVAFVLLLLVFAVGVVSDIVSRALSPGGLVGAPP